MTTSANRRTAAPTKKSRTSRIKGEPVWELAHLYPPQGEWTESDFLDLSNATNHPIELVDGCVEFLPMPEIFHQRILVLLFKLLDAFVSNYKLGEVLFAPSPIRLWTGRIREPDIFLLQDPVVDPHEPPDKIALAMEIVSPGKKSRQRDLKDKRRDYARAGVQEYWIVDPAKKTISVLALAGKSYKVHGNFKSADQATSKLLPGFSVKVAEVWAAGEGK